jgi:hypothetical protein
VPVHRQELVLRPGALARREDALEQRPDRVPDLRPDLAAGRPRAQGCLPPAIGLQSSL